MQNINRLFEEIKKMATDGQLSPDELSKNLVRIAEQGSEWVSVATHNIKRAEKYVQIFDASPVAVCIINDDSAIIEANLALSNLLGVNKRFLVDKPFSIFLESESNTIFFDSIGKLLNKQEHTQFDLRIKTADGDLLWVMVNASLYAEHASGYLIQIVLTPSPDLGNRLRQAEAYRTQMQAVFEAENTINVYLDAQLKITNLNKYGYTILGYQLNDLIKQSFVNRLLIGDQAAVFKSWISKNQNSNIKPIFTLVSAQTEYIDVKVEVCVELNGNSNYFIQFSNLTPKKFSSSLLALTSDLQSELLNQNSNAQTTALNLLAQWPYINGVALIQITNNGNCNTLFSHGLFNEIEFTSSILTNLDIKRDVFTNPKNTASLLTPVQALALLTDPDLVKKNRIWLQTIKTQQLTGFGYLFVSSSYLFLPDEAFATLTHHLSMLIEANNSLILASNLALDATQGKWLIEDHITDVIIELNSNGVILRATRSVEKLTGFPASEIEGTSLVRLYHPDDLALARQQSITQVTHFRIKSKREWYNYVQASFFKHPYKPDALVAVLKNVGPLMLLKNENTDLSEKLRQASEARFKFLERVSHELRTPLNGITGMVDLALSDENLPTHLFDYLSTINESANQLLDLINRMLDLTTQNEGAAIEPETEDFSLHYEVNKIVGQFRQKAEQKNIELITQISKSTPPYLRGDSERLLQIIYNLIDNAIKFTSEGKCWIRVDVDRQRQSVEDVFSSDEIALRFVIEDTGAGIPPEKYDQIFELFTQLEESERKPVAGAGLGLPITKKLVETLGGEISVAPRVGRGTRFTFTATFKQGDPANIPQARLILPKQTANLPSVAILLVEDSRVNQKIASIMFRQMGHSVEVANDGLEAIELLRQKHFDVVFMDVQMPNMDGIEATKHVRNILKSDVPIVAMTAFAIAGDRERFLSEGMNYYISKPISVADVEMALLAVLTSSANLNANQKKYLTHATDLPANNPPFDIDGLLKKVGGDTQTLIMLYSLFFGNEIKRLEKIKSAINNQNILALKQELHGLKGSALSVGANQLAQMVANFEKDPTAIIINKQPDIIINSLKFEIETLRSEVDNRLHIQTPPATQNH